MMSDSIEEHDEASEVSYATSHKMLGKLKNISAMAISVTTGKKLQVKKNPLQSNVIPGFGYADRAAVDAGVKFYRTISWVSIAATAAARRG